MLSAPKLFLAAAVAFHSFAPSLADPDTTITAAPARRTPSDGELAARQASETTSPLPLTDYQYPYSAIPEQVNPFAVGRGPQSGYNICNSTTENANSLCQTLAVNNVSDWCLWGSPVNDGLIGNVEASVVAYCTQKGHGTRLITPGSITGVQFMRTSAYIQITGHFNQTGINLDPNDYGGELDPHGADLMGNPLGGLVYSTGLPSAKDNTTYLQATNWNTFVGSGIFCFKLCDPTVTSPDYCQNIYDLLGCTYNMPAAYKDGEFTSCEGDLQAEVGTYTSNGQTITWSQPASLDPSSTIPWTPVIPASSNCVTYSSAELFGSATTSGSSSPTGSSGKSGSSSGTKAGSAAGSSSTSGSSNAAPGTVTIGASSLMASTALFAVIGAIVALM